MSGIFRQLLGSFDGQQDTHANITDILQQVLAQNGGGVATLLSRCQQSGLGDQAKAWVNGDHQPISGDQISQVFNDDEINGWASQLGVDPDKMRGMLAQALPHAVDHATPDGQVPNTVPDLSGLVGRFFGR